MPPMTLFHTPCAGPVNPVFIWFSLLVAFALNLVPLGRIVGMPDFLAVALVFWNVHQPRRVGVGTAFVFGLFMDVHHGALLGQHALVYTVLGYLAVMIHRRLQKTDQPDSVGQVQTEHIFTRTDPVTDRNIRDRADGRIN